MKRSTSWIFVYLFALITTACGAASPAMAFTASVNFQPPNTPAYAGYLVDEGVAYAKHSNGYSYGWNNTNNHARARNSHNSPDQRYDTFNSMADFTWEIGVPNGWYAVRIVAGDANSVDGVYKINAEGIPVVDGKPTSYPWQPWVEGSATVAVHDGKLSVSSGHGAVNNKICFIQFKQLDSSTSASSPGSGSENTSINIGEPTSSSAADTAAQLSKDSEIAPRVLPAVAVALRWVAAQGGKRAAIAAFKQLLKSGVKAQVKANLSKRLLTRGSARHYLQQADNLLSILDNNSWWEWVQDLLPVASERQFAVKLYEAYNKARSLQRSLNKNLARSRQLAKLFKVAKYKNQPRPRPYQTEAHHGMLSQWMKSQFGSRYNAGEAPTVLMSKVNHNATRRILNIWKKETARSMGGNFSWNKVSEAQMKDLSNKMFDVAKVPGFIREQYWDQYLRMMNALRRP